MEPIVHKIDKDGCLNLSPLPGQERCDFCSSEDVRWDIDCEAIVTSEGMGSRDSWAACTPCKEMVESQQWEALEKRSFDSLYEQYKHEGIPDWAAKRFIHELHGLFRLKRGQIRPFYKNVA